MATPNANPSDSVTVLFDVVTQHAGAMAGKLSDAGLALLTGLAVIQLCWTIFKNIVAEDGGGLNKTIGESMMLTLTVGILVWLIRDLDSVAKPIIDGFDWIAAKLVGVQQGQNMATVIFDALAKIASDIWDGMASDQDPGLWDIIKNTIAGAGSFWLKILIVLALALVAVVAVAIFIWSQVQVLLALALLPIFLPFYILPVTQQWADGMVNFFFKSAAMKMVALVLMAICIQMINGTNAMVAASNADKMALDLYGMMQLLLVTIVVLFMMIQVPSITNNMFSGQTIGLSRILPGGVSPSKLAGKPAPGTKPPTKPTPPTVTTSKTP